MKTTIVTLNAFRLALAPAIDRIEIEAEVEQEGITEIIEKACNDCERVFEGDIDPFKGVDSWDALEHFGSEQMMTQLGVIEMVEHVYDREQQVALEAFCRIFDPADILHGLESSDVLDYADGLKEPREL